MPVHKPKTGKASPRCACTHPIRIIEGDATGVVNVNQLTYSHGVIAKTASRLCCLKGEHHDRCNRINGIQIYK